MSEETGKIPEEALSFLENADKAYGKNTGKLTGDTPAPIAEKQSSLGKAVTPEQQTSKISGANDTGWKNIPAENLPSRGLFYPDDTEITTRAASVAEIRHWSTIDENDMLNVNDMMNFIIEKCVRLRTKDQGTWLSWRDIAEVDRMYLLFSIHEQTFPNKENTLWTKFSCGKGCANDGTNYSTEIRTTSSLIQSFELSEEAMKYYKPEYKCFEVVSEKLNETFYLYAPTLGNIEKVKNRILADRKKNKPVDPAFVKIAQYLIQDWNSFDDAEYTQLRSTSLGWPHNKFAFINRFAELYEKSKSSSVYLMCPNCGSQMTSPLFLGSSFTIKSLFLVSGRLDELV
jgi:hypothetical protein